MIIFSIALNDWDGLIFESLTIHISVLNRMLKLIVAPDKKGIFIKAGTINRIID